MGKHILYQLQNGKPFRLRMETLERLTKEYFATNTLPYYPDKVVLSLEDFCKFYFKELKEIKVQERINIACNDSMLMFRDTMLENIFRDASDYEKNEADKDVSDSLSTSYAEKFAISKFAVYKYLRSGQSATELLADEAYWSKIKHRLISQCIELHDEQAVKLSRYNLVRLDSDWLNKSSHVRKLLNNEKRLYFFVESSKTRKTL